MRITVNLAPAGLRKGGAAFDLPIVVEILAFGKLPGKRCWRCTMTGEQGLDGSVPPVQKVLSLASLPLAGYAAYRLSTASTSAELLPMSPRTGQLLMVYSLLFAVGVDL